MNNAKAIYTIVLLFSISTAIHAQEIKPKHILSFRGNCNVPHAISNKAFRKSFNGVYDLNAMLEVNPFNGFIVGLGYKNTLFDIPAKLIRGLSTTTMQTHSFYGRLGFNYFSTERLFLSGAFNMGECITKFTGVPYAAVKLPKYEYTSLYIEPEAGINFMIEEFFSIGFNVSVNINSKSFDPYFIYLNDFTSYFPNELGKNTVTLNFGFGFTYGIIPHKGIKIDKTIE